MANDYPPAKTSLSTDGPRIVTNSTMWQSETWNQHVVNVLTEDEEHWRAPYPSSLATAWRLFRRRNEGQVVAPMGGGAALYYCLFARLRGCAKPAQVVHEFFLPEPAPHSLRWRLKRRVRRWAFAQTAAIVVYADVERQLCADYLQLPLERFHFVPFHTNILEPRFQPEAAYGFAAGRSGRDYETFFAAVRGLDYPFVVVADQASLSGLAIPPNVQVRCDIAREEYLALLCRAAFAVVPLHRRHCSTGQVVVLEAYSMGKPVVATEVVGTLDYVRQGETGHLCPPYDPRAMQVAIEQLIGQPTERDRMGRNAVELVQSKYTFPMHVERLLAVMRLAANAARSSIDSGGVSARWSSSP
jgi:glycosyltransferase involved in cell wall biosynthesis